MKSLSLRCLGMIALTLSVSAAHACYLCGSPGRVHPAGETVPPAEHAGGVSGAPAPPLSSRPGAAYTVYLNFDGFAFNGNWGGDVRTVPGTTPAYSGSTAQLREIWARTAEKYAPFNVNVTTVDPAIAAGQATTDTVRQSYYDNTARLMHTVVGGNGSWFGGGGVSYVGVTQNSYTGTGFSNGYHTNWAFSAQSPGNLQFVADVSAHENGHGFGLNHQSDYTSNTSNNEYSSNANSTGNGSFAPIMGNSYDTQRGTFRVGTQLVKNGSGAVTGSTIQNDVQVIRANSGMTYTEDGIGHSFATATLLPLAGTSVDSTLAKGVIVPTATAPDPLGINNYSKDYFRFSMGTAGAITMNLANGGDWLTPGIASIGATLRSKLNIYQAGNLATPFAFGTESASTLFSTFNGTLSAGDYIAEITSFGGFQSGFDANSKYFSMGSYVLSGGAITPALVPEGGTLALLSAGLTAFAVRRKRNRTKMV